MSFRTSRRDEIWSLYSAVGLVINVPKRPRSDAKFSASWNAHPMTGLSRCKIGSVSSAERTQEKHHLSYDMGSRV